MCTLQGIFRQGTSQWWWNSSCIGTMEKRESERGDKGRKCDLLLRSRDAEGPPTPPKNAQTVQNEGSYAAVLWCLQCPCDSGTLVVTGDREIEIGKSFRSNLKAWNESFWAKLKAWNGGSFHEEIVFQKIIFRETASQKFNLSSILSLTISQGERLIVVKEQILCETEKTKDFQSTKVPGYG